MAKLELATFDDSVYASSALRVAHQLLDNKSFHEGTGLLKTNNYSELLSKPLQKKMIISLWSLNTLNFKRFV